MNTSNEGSHQSETLEERKFGLEAERWKYQKEWREREFEQETRKLEQAKRDTLIRGLLSSLLGTLLVVSIPASLTLYARKAEEQKSIRAEEQRKQETLIQLISSREAADSSLRAQMFNALLQNYFREHDLRTQIAILEIIGLNFRDSLHTKPMFERLHAEIEESGEEKEKTVELLEVLRKAAQRIIKDQLQQIKQSEEGDVCDIEFKTNSISITPQNPTCFQDLAVRLVEITDEQVVVQTNSKDGLLIDASDGATGDKFGVSYYDMPMVDYTIVSSYGTIWKYSIVLKDIDRVAGLVTIAIANLPEDTFGTSEEYKFDEMLREYLTES